MSCEEELGDDATEADDASGDPRLRPLGEVLARDHRKDEFAILARDATVEQALALWTRNPRLEAVIITERGRAEESPLGIATATDLIKLLER